MSERVTKTFTITASAQVMRRFERLVHMLHLNSNWGHSAIFGMPLDGDGADRFKLETLDRSLVPEIDLIAGVGSGLEMAIDNGCAFWRATSTDWIAKDGRLYRDGAVVRVHSSVEEGGDV